MSIAVAMGEGATMTPEIRQRLEEFVTNLMADEPTSLESLGGCGGVYDSCGIFDCNLNNCSPVVKKPCAYLVSCRINVPPSES